MGRRLRGGRRPIPHFTAFHAGYARYKDPENTAPREIDEALLKHPAVLEAAAVGIPDANYGQDIMACVILKPGTDCTVEALVEFSVQELGKYKAPKIIKFVTELPKGPSSKVQRLKLLEG